LINEDSNLQKVNCRRLIKELSRHKAFSIIPVSQRYNSRNCLIPYPALLSSEITLEKKSQSEQKLNSIESMQVLEKPAASSVPVSPNKKLNIVVAGVLGLMLGVFAAFIADYFRHNPLKLNK
jgi:LPS O-antigen subunit length determinant protein (WzzB/FepE family)